MSPSGKKRDVRERSLTTRNYISALRSLAPLHPTYLRMLQVHYFQPARTITHELMAKLVGFKGSAAANAHYGKLGHRVGERLDWLPKYKVNVLVHFVDPQHEGRCHWKMRGRLAGALEALGWVTDAPELELMPGEMPGGTQLFEGAVHQVAVNAYERNPEARRLCLAHYGTSCWTCGANLKERYGLGEDFIHVHHVLPLGEIGKQYRVDPVNDLRPVCPNCHSVIHLRTPPYTIEEVKAMVTASQGVRKAPWEDPPELREARLRQPIVAFSDFPPPGPHKPPKRVAAPPKRLTHDLT